MLKRQNVPLDRDVIALFEAGEEGADARRHPVHGRQALRRHRRRVLPRRRRRRHAAERTSEVRVDSVARENSARDPADRQGRRRPRLGAAASRIRSCGSRMRSRRSANGRRRFGPTRPRPRTSSAWPRSRRPKKRSAIATCSAPIPRSPSAADEYFRANEPRHASMLRTSASPNMFTAGYRVNVIPSEATRDARCAHAARRGSESVSRAGEEGGQRSVD